MTLYTFLAGTGRTRKRPGRPTVCSIVHGAVVAGLVLFVWIHTGSHQTEEPALEPVGRCRVTHLELAAPASATSCTAGALATRGTIAR